jgi:hypothetical protein
MAGLAFPLITGPVYGDNVNNSRLIWISHCLFQVLLKHISRLTLFLIMVLVNDNHCFTFFADRTCPLTSNWHSMGNHVSQSYHPSWDRGVIEMYKQLLIFLLVVLNFRTFLSIFITRLQIAAQTRSELF